MPRIRKEPNRFWSKEEKLRIVNRVIIEGNSARSIAMQEDISAGMLRNWIRNYLEKRRILLRKQKETRKSIDEIFSKKISYFSGKIRV